MRVLCDELAQDVDAVAGTESLADAVPILRDALAGLADMTSWVIGCRRDDDWLAAATPFLELASLAVCGGLLARKLRWTVGHRSAEEIDRCTGELRFFALERVSHARAHQPAILAGAERLEYVALSGVG